MSVSETIPTRCIVCSSVIASGLTSVCQNAQCNAQVKRVFKAYNILKKANADLLDALEGIPMAVVPEETGKGKKDERIRISSDTTGTTTASNPVPKTK